MPGLTYFLIIAIENYNNPKSFKRVTYAEKDAQDLTAAYYNLGYDKDDFVILLNHHATKTAVEESLKAISSKALEEDRVIVYFAGHGFNNNGESLIAPVDAIANSLQHTCISVNLVLGYLKKARSTRNLLFLDCCHSGFEPGENIRDITSDFLTEDLIYALKDEVYCIGFASCQSHQVSISDPKLQNGVWSHFLIKALKGDAEDIYEEGILVSDNLQSYLRAQTFAFVKKNTDDKRDQIPMQFGSLSDKFVIEDLRDLFNQREAERKSSQLSLTSVVIFDIEDGTVKSLPGFKRNHTVPDKFGRVFDSFIKSISGDMVEEEIEELSEEIKDKLNYSIREISVESNKGYGKIETHDFVYEVELSQSEENPKEYIIRRSLSTIVNDEIVNEKAFNEVFSQTFRQLSFRFDKKINVEDLIYKSELIAKKTGKFKVKYSPANTSTCTITFPDSVTEIVITPVSINITVPRATSPINLIEVYKDTTLRIESANIPLLN